MAWKPGLTPQELEEAKRYDAYLDHLERMEQVRKQAKERAAKQKAYDRFREKKKDPEAVFAKRVHLTEQQKHDAYLKLLSCPKVRYVDLAAEFGCSESSMSRAMRRLKKEAAAAKGATAGV